ncbi:MAG: hypothetical protein QXJ64_03520 [Thermosphaera sp.]
MRAIVIYVIMTILIVVFAWTFNLIYAIVDLVLSILSLILGYRVTLMYDPKQTIVIALSLLFFMIVITIIVQIMRMIRERRMRGGIIF